MKSPTHFFNLEPSKEKNKELLIFFNLNYGYCEYNPMTDKKKYVPMRISTRQRIQKKYWDNENYKADISFVRKFGKTLNNELTNVEEVSYNTLNTYYGEYGKIPKPKELKELVMVKLERKEKIIQDSTLKYFITEKIKYFENLPQTATNKVERRTIQTYSNILIQIAKYEEATNEILTFNNFDEAKYWNFFTVINDVYKKEKELPYGYMVNSIAKTSKTFLSLMRMAEQDEIPMILKINKKGLRIQEVKKSNEIYLNEKHLLKIMNANVSHSSELNNAKNYLIISSLTGLRYDDMYHLHELKIEKYKGRHKSFKGFTTLVRKVSKLNKDVFICIPLFKAVQTIINDNDGKFPKFPTNQKMNEQIKKLCKFLKFDEEIECNYLHYKQNNGVKETTPLHKLVQTHTGRKSYYTNLTLHQVNRNVIENITHPKFFSKTMSSIYDKSSIIDNAELLLDAIEKIKSKIYKY